MRLALTPHPDFPCQALSAIEVEVLSSSPGELTLTYVAAGAIDRLVLPPAAFPARTDELWRTTCFEAFLSTGTGDGYFEFNFAPSTEWAAYRFSGYRAGMTELDLAAPRIAFASSDSRCEMTVTLDLPAAQTPCRLGLTAVIEEKTGAKSYWALAHAPGRPDFHAATGFAAELPAP